MNDDSVNYLVDRKWRRIQAQPDEYMQNKFIFTDGSITRFVDSATFDNFTVGSVKSTGNFVALLLANEETDQKMVSFFDLRRQKIFDSSYCDWKTVATSQFFLPTEYEWSHNYSDNGIKRAETEIKTCNIQKYICFVLTNSGEIKAYDLEAYDRCHLVEAKNKTVEESGFELQILTTPNSREYTTTSTLPQYNQLGVHQGVHDNKSKTESVTRKIPRFPYGVKFYNELTDAEKQMINGNLLIDDTVTFDDEGVCVLDILNTDVNGNPMAVGRDLSLNEKQRYHACEYKFQKENTDYEDVSFLLPQATCICCDNKEQLVFAVDDMLFVAHISKLYDPPDYDDDATSRDLKTWTQNDIDFKVSRCNLGDKSEFSLQARESDGGVWLVVADLVPFQTLGSGAVKLREVAEEVVDEDLYGEELGPVREVEEQRITAQGVTRKQEQTFTLRFPPKRPLSAVKYEVPFSGPKQEKEHANPRSVAVQEQTIDDSAAGPSLPSDLTGLVFPKHIKQIWAKDDVIFVQLVDNSLFARGNNAHNKLGIRSEPTLGSFLDFQQCAWDSAHGIKELSMHENNTFIIDTQRQLWVCGSQKDATHTGFSEKGTKRANNMVFKINTSTQGAAHSGHHVSRYVNHIQEKALKLPSGLQNNDVLMISNNDLTYTSNNDKQISHMFFEPMKVQTWTEPKEYKPETGRIGEWSSFVPTQFTNVNHVFEQTVTTGEGKQKALYVDYDKTSHDGTRSNQIKNLLMILDDDIDTDWQLVRNGHIVAHAGQKFTESQNKPLEPAVPARTRHHNQSNIPKPPKLESFNTHTLMELKQDDLMQINTFLNSCFIKMQEFVQTLETKDIAPLKAEDVKNVSLDEINACIEQNTNKNETYTRFLKVLKESKEKQMEIQKLIAKKTPPRLILEQNLPVASMIQLEREQKNITEFLSNNPNEPHEMLNKRLAMIQEWIKKNQGEIIASEIGKLGLTQQYDLQTLTLQELENERDIIQGFLEKYKGHSHEDLTKLERLRDHGQIYIEMLQQRKSDLKPASNRARTNNTVVPPPPSQQVKPAQPEPPLMRLEPKLPPPPNTEPYVLTIPGEDAIKNMNQSTSKQTFLQGLHRHIENLKQNYDQFEGIQHPDELGKFLTEYQKVLKYMERCFAETIKKLEINITENPIWQEEKAIRELQFLLQLNAGFSITWPKHTEIPENLDKKQKMAFFFYLKCYMFLGENRPNLFYGPSAESFQQRLNSYKRIINLYTSLVPEQQTFVYMKTKILIPDKKDILSKFTQARQNVAYYIAYE